MTAILLDTHAWVWSFADSKQLSRAAHTAIDGASTVYVSPITLFEIGQKVRLGKWPGLPSLSSLPGILRDQGCVVAPLTPEICLHAGQRIWTHRDPFDRLLASTAEILGLLLISQDAVFKDLSAIHCVW